MLTMLLQCGQEPGQLSGMDTAQIKRKSGNLKGSATLSVPPPPLNRGFPTRMVYLKHDI